MLLENEQGSEALLAANEGLTKNESNDGLKYLTDAIANQKSIDTFQFGMMWYSMFPEQLTVGRDEDAKSNARSVRRSSDESSNEKGDEKEGIQSLRVGATEGRCLLL